MIIISLIGHWSLVIGHFSLAEVYLKDVPQGHYAYESVYDLVKQGITNGFPDGTYRGNKMMTRYELAGFMSKFIQSKNLDRSRNEKMVEEMKAEVALVQYDRTQAAMESRFSGNFIGRWRAGRTENRHGAKADYRLQANFAKNFGDLAGLKIILDTLDTGFDGGSRDLVRDLLAVEGIVKLGTAQLKLTSGPGDIVHQDDGLFPVENNQIYQQPWRAAYFNTGFAQTSVALGLISRSNYSTGTIEVYELNAGIAQDFAPFRVALSPRLFSNVNGIRNIRLELTGEFEPQPGYKVSLLAGSARQAGYPHNLFIKGELMLGGIRLLAQKVGGQYRNTVNYNILDIFDRNILDGSTSVGGELKVSWSNFSATAKADWTMPAEVFTKEFRLGNNIKSEMAVDLFYQAYNAAQALGGEIKISF